MSVRGWFVDTDGMAVPGLLVAALFAVFAAVFLTAEIGTPAGFPGEGSIVASIGYAMFNITGQAAFGSERFLIAFEIIDVVLVAALVGAVMLARREEEGSVVTALTDGGRNLRDSIRDDDGGED